MLSSLRLYSSKIRLCEQHSGICRGCITTLFLPGSYLCGFVSALVVEWVLLLCTAVLL